MVYRNLHFILGAPGLMIGAFSILTFLFGIYIITREYNRPRKTEQDVIRQVVATWIGLPDYLGLTLFDYAHRWQVSPMDRREAAAIKLKLALYELGLELDKQSERFPLVQLLEMEIAAQGTGSLASWRSDVISGVVDDTMRDTIPLVESNPDGGAVVLTVVYQVAPAFQSAAKGLEESYRELLLGVLGLAGFSLLCMGYMIVQAKSLSDRAAREAAQDATLDLADRTCHELGNGIFILANEQKNLSDHLDLIERFIREEPIAREAAARRAGVVDKLEKRWEHALKRERRSRGIDPDSELRGSVALTRRVAEQIQICAHYIGMTVRELDSFLKRSEVPVDLGHVDLVDCVDEAVALLRPRIEAAEVTLERRFDNRPIPIHSDRRLLIHVLVNLIKNAIEAVEIQEEKIIEIHGVSDSNQVKVTVSDHGAGIPEQALRQIFERGFSTKGRGRGHGLSIVSDSILLLGSTLEVRNRDEGGAEFSFSLPCSGAGVGGSNPEGVQESAAGDIPVCPT